MTGPSSERTADASKYALPWTCPHGIDGRNCVKCADAAYTASERTADADVATLVDHVSANLVCLVHRMPDCSPLLNGCSRVNQSHAALDCLAALDAASAIVEPEPVVGLDETRDRVAELADSAARLAAGRERFASLQQTVAKADAPEHRLALVNAEANEGRLAAQIPGWHVELRTQTATLKGELRDALDVVVHTGPLQETDYAQLSGGEKTRVAIALRLGVARLLANRRGADCRLLALDEPDALDAEGKQALVEILQERAASYSTVILISHDSDLRDRFDHSIQLEAADPQPEPVLA